VEVVGVDDRDLDGSVAQPARHPESTEPGSDDDDPVLALRLVQIRKQDEKSP
jgi:hypothetical protein